MDPYQPAGLSYYYPQPIANIIASNLRLSEQLTVEQEIEALEKEWDLIVDGLPKDQAALLKMELRMRIAGIRGEYQRIGILNYDSAKIRSDIRTLITQSQGGLSDFLANMKTAQLERIEVAKEYQLVTNQIRSAKLSLASFSPKTVCKATKAEEQDSTKIFYLLGEAEEPVHETSICPANFSSSTENEKHESHFIKDTVIKVVSKIVKAAYGKSASIAFKIVAKSALGCPSEESENPSRDLAISSAVSVGFAELLQFGMKRTPAYAAVATSNFVHDIAVVGQEGIAKMQQDEEIKEIWNYQANFSLDGLRFETSMALAQGLLTTARAPGDFLQEVQQQITAMAIYYADEYGVTQQNITQVFNQTMCIIYENNPELFEGAYWAL